MSKLTHYCFTQCIPHYSEYNLKYAIFQPTIKHFPETNGVDFSLKSTCYVYFKNIKIIRVGIFSNYKSTTRKPRLLICYCPYRCCCIRHIRFSKCQFYIIRTPHM